MQQQFQVASSLSLVVCVIIKLWSFIFICLCLTATIEPASTGASVDTIAGDTPSPTARTKLETRFSNRIENQTVPIRRQAVFDCSIDNVANYKVAWLKRDALSNDTTLLSLDDKLIIGDTDNKFKILKMYQNRNWRLIINNVQLSDKGHYMCQLSTKPIKYQSAFLDVQIPPTIIDAQTSGNLVQVDEFQRLELRCHAQGHPRPEIEWRKESHGPAAIGYAGANNNNNNFTNNDNDSDNRAGQTGSAKSLISLTRGDTYVIDRVTRFEAGVYLCIANNKVPPAVSHRITVRVNYGPIVNVLDKTVESAPGEQVELECQIEAYPPVLDVRWIRSQDQAELADSGNGNLADNLAKYSIKSVTSRQLTRHYHHEVSMTTSKLIIFNVQQQDYGSYQCLASNNLTNRDAHIRLHETRGRYLEPDWGPNEHRQRLADEDNGVDLDGDNGAPIGDTSNGAQLKHDTGWARAPNGSAADATSAKITAATATTKFSRAYPPAPALHNSAGDRQTMTKSASSNHNNNNNSNNNGNNNIVLVAANHRRQQQQAKQSNMGHILLVGNSGAPGVQICNVGLGALALQAASLMVTLYARLTATTTLHNN